MADAANSLDILVNISSRLDELVKATSEVRRLRIEAATTSQSVKSGFGNLFGNMFGAGLAVNAVSRAVSVGLNLVTGSMREANNTFEKSRNLEISVQGYTKLRDVIRQSGGDVNSLDMAIERLNQSIAAARTGDDAKLNTLRALRLDPVDMEAMEGEERFVRLARAVANSSDRLKAWQDVGDLIGSRTLKGLREGLNELAENGFGSVANSATEAEARGTSAIHSFFDSIEENTAVLKSKIVTDAGGFLSLLGYGSDEPVDREITRADITKLRNIQQQRDALKALQLDLKTLGITNELITSDPSYTDTQKKFWVNQAAGQTIKLLDLMQALRAQMPLDNQTPEERKAELAALDLQIKALTQSVRAPVSAYRREKEQFENLNIRPDSNAVGNSNYLSIGEGLDAGPMRWVSSLGSMGEQVAATLENSIGGAVKSISDGIYGWVTGTETFEDMLLNVGTTALRALIDGIVQMGVQWVVAGGLGKMALTGIHMLGSVLRGKETAEVIAAESAKTPALMTNAAAANAGSFGMSALIGIAILAAVMAAFGGFASGGYTGDMPANQIAGVVHGREGVLNAAAMSRLGIDNLNALNAGVPLSAASAPAAFGGGGAAGAAAVGGGRESGRNYHFYLDRHEFLDAMRNDISGIAHEIYNKRARE